MAHIVTTAAAATTTTTTTTTIRLQPLLLLLLLVVVVVVVVLLLLAKNNYFLALVSLYVPMENPDPAGRIFVNLHWRNLTKINAENSGLAKIGEDIGTLCEDLCRHMISRYDKLSWLRQSVFFFRYILRQTNSTAGVSSKFLLSIYGRQVAHMKKESKSRLNVNLILKQRSGFCVRSGM